jgi:hypothetical protein
MSGQKIGWRPYSPSGNNAVSTLLTSLYGAWNGDTTGTSLDTSIFGAWNAEASGTPLDTSIFAVYNADGDANDSKGTNHGTLVNGATFSTGKIGQAFQFDGTNDYLKLPNNSLNFIDDFSVGFWMKLGSLNQTSYIIDSAGFSGIGTTGWVLNLTSGNLNFTIHNNNNASSIGANYVLTSTSVWYHIVITSKSGYNAIYINNSLIMSNTSTMRPNYVTSSYSIPYIGVFKTANTQFFNGNIDGLNFWNKSLTVDEVTQLYNSGNGAQYPYSSQSLPSPNDAVGTNHGSLMNGVAFSTGKVGNAFTFDGVNDYVSFPTNSWNSLVGTDLTISLWVKFASTANQTLISNMSSPSINVWSGWEIRLVGGQPTIYMWNNSGTGVGAQGSVISTNTWYHIVATRKKGSRTRIYINGSLAQTDTNTPDPSINGTYYPNIGHLQYSSTYHGLYMTNGSLIDSVDLWSKEISADEVTQLYNSGTGAQYPFSTQTLPSSGNQFGVDNGTLMNGCSLTTGKIGQSFTFDGVNDYVALPDNSLNFTGDFSASAWIYVSNVSGEKYIISNSNGNIFDVNTGWCFGVFDNKVSFWVYPGTSSFTGWLTNTTLSLNTWHHVSVTKKPSQSPLLYINGVLSSTSLYNNTMSNSLNPVYSTATYPNTKASIGVYRYNNGSSAYAYWNGKIDALNVWQKELTQSEITELYNSGNGKQITATPIVTNGLVLNLDASRTSSYPNTGTTWTDISGNGNNGTMVNGPTFGTASGGQITFDGVNDYVSTSYFGGDNSNYTFSVWYNPSGNANTYPIQRGRDGSGSGWNILLGSDNSSGNRYRTAVVINNTIMYITYSTFPMELNSWVNLTGVFISGSKLSLYINGVLNNSVSVPVGNLRTSTDGWFLGSLSTSAYSNVKISVTQIYNRALTDSEITQNFNATKSRFGL